MSRIEEHETHGYGVDAPRLDEVGDVVAIRHFFYLSVWV